MTKLQRATLGLWLTWIAGFVDAVGYIVLYRVFTAHMSGNTVALAVEAVQHRWLRMAERGWAIPMFVCGLLLGGILHEAGRRKVLRHTFAIALGAEMILLVVFIALGRILLSNGQLNLASGSLFFVAESLPALAMGIQNVTLTRVGALTLYTTFVTGTLVKFAESVSAYLFWFHDRTKGRFHSRIGQVLAVSPRQKHLRHATLTAFMWLSYVVGAGCGALSKQSWQLAALAIPIAMLAVCLIFEVKRPLSIIELNPENP